MLLNGWKEIAAHLGRGVRTVQRWESIGIPVHRPHTKLRSAVVADSDELDAWIRASSTCITDLEQLREVNAVLRNDCERLQKECETLRHEMDDLRQQNRVLRTQLDQARVAIQRNRLAVAAVKQSA